MDPRIPRLRRRLAAIPFQPLRSHSFGEEQHKFSLGPKLWAAGIAAFEAEHRITLPDAFGQFLTHIGGSGAGPFYGIMPLKRCSLLVMDPRGEPGKPRGFSNARPAENERDLFLHIIEMGCTDVCVLAVTGPLTGRVLMGNSDGYWGPNVSSVTDRRVQRDPGLRDTQETPARETHLAVPPQAFSRLQNKGSGPLLVERLH
ncbi:hypothetical protein DWB77_07472 [Streptomyces hundungensis]|uniref:Knr4/Smi1-like domain-containing protein n=1 Tax=Streptomyces hundungensis TaxID=1077946 RepID=A0A387HMZ8_9ACTN|nr:SMI1/KNR4 family protein [Streptomyces hundungensis]AYG85255.1 hypothetical protein DWB77_07472 [Streptomyces hundungensis]